MVKGHVTIPLHRPVLENSLIQMGHHSFDFQLQDEDVSQRESNSFTQPGPVQSCETMAIKDRTF